VYQEASNTWSPLPEAQLPAATTDLRCTVVRGGFYGGARRVAAQVCAVRCALQPVVLAGISLCDVRSCHDINIEGATDAGRPRCRRSRSGRRRGTRCGARPTRWPRSTSTSWRRRCGGALRSWTRPILTEIYLCHGWACQEISRAETPGQAEVRDAAAWSEAEKQHLVQLVRRFPGGAMMRDTPPPPPAMPAVVRVRVEIMGPAKYENVGNSQSVLIMIDPIIFTRRPPRGRADQETHTVVSGG
jgi:hypothetical protein